jgi:4'-phosphopantetheinyl transferase EntD
MIAARSRNRPTVIETILPVGAVGADTWSEVGDGGLFAAERSAVSNAVPARRAAFTAGRACAHRALQQLGAPVCPILKGQHGEPLWPSGVVGSVTHCAGYRACAVAHADVIATLGIDAEEHAPLSRGVLSRLATLDELASLQALAGSGAPHWDRLLFSAKESAYTAWFPFAGKRLRWADIVVTFRPDAATFFVRLAGPDLGLGRQRLTTLEGRWLVRCGLIITSVAVSDAQRAHRSDA